MFVSIATTTLFEASFPLRFLGDDLTFKATRVDGPWNSTHGWSKAETPDKASDDATSWNSVTNRKDDCSFGNSTEKLDVDSLV